MTTALHMIETKSIIKKVHIERRRVTRILQTDSALTVKDSSAILLLLLSGHLFTVKSNTFLDY